ncbi:hypothetical protein KKD52_12730 [Myxococcota bacterium]|nr:hypothetical protein [Myxococcota bacterium]MBU1410634.1 hypothetical protein [Myxococcota bacterium]MBU1511217.1 hypothetical protein [Myxococcota bacterium]
MSRFSELRFPKTLHPGYTGLAIFLITGLVYALVSGPRVLSASKNNHFAYLARAHLAGTTRLVDPRPHGNDWARVQTLTLADGRVLSGTYWKTHGPNTFRTLSGDFVVVDPGTIRTRSERWYVTFPPMPAWMMTPGVILWGLHFNDVLFTLVLSALNAMLLWFLLLLARQKGLHGRSDGELAALVTLFAFGTVNFFSSVRGEVWYTAHVAGMTWTILYLMAVLRRKPAWAGFFLGAAFLCRTPMLFAGLIYPAYVWHRDGGLPGIRRAWREALLHALPLLGLVALAMALNFSRFGNPFDFGHQYLEISWRRRMEQYGLFSVEYLSRNLSAMLTLLPRFSLSHPFVKISPHGMALWLTTPVFLLLLRASWKDVFARRILLLGVLPVAGLALLYQNSGFVQFGYRFSLDFTVFLMLLLAMSSIRFGRWFTALLAFSIAVNLFGAITFGRMHAFYPGGSFFFFVS